MGYGDITSASDLERTFAIVGMIIGATVFGYIIGNVAVIMENFNVVDAIESGKMNQVKDWLYDRKVCRLLHTAVGCFAELGSFIVCKEGVYLRESVILLSEDRILACRAKLGSNYDEDHTANRVLRDLCR